MITLRSGLYKESDLYYLIRVIEHGECLYYGTGMCYTCQHKRACEDVQRLKGHIIKLINEHSFSEK